MGSRFSPPKSAPGADSAILARLLWDGWRFEAPNETVLKSAERLERLGLVAVSRQEYVVCADSEDDDFPPMNRDCTGRILLRDGLDEGGDEFRCPECERPVYPFMYNKRRHQELRSRVRPDGVLAFLREELEAIGNFRQMADGVFRVETDSGEVLICVVELCRDSRYLSRDHARMHPTIFVGTDSRNLTERLLPEPWLIRVSVADLVAGDADFSSLLDDLQRQGSPPSLINASLPVYNKVLPALLHTDPLDTPRQAFMVEFLNDRLLLENVVIVAGKSGMQLQVFGILWQRFLEDLATGLMPDDFRVISVSELTDIIDNGSQGDAIDDLNVRRALNRLQLDLMETVRRNLGRPIEREDIIQNLRADGKRRKRNGYRINPSMVLPKAPSCS